jgi:hypothetical protein
MFTMRTTTSLVPFTVRTMTQAFGTTYRGRQHLSSYDSSVMLARALSQPTLIEKVDALKNAVKMGADINGKIHPQNKSLLYIVNSMPCHKADFAPLTEAIFSLDGVPNTDFAALTEAIFSLGGVPNKEECLTGSLLHESLSLRKSIRNIVAAIVLYPRGGVNVNTLNDNYETPLDLAYKHHSHEVYRNLFIKLLRQEGAVHGFNFHSGRSNPIVTIPAATIAMPLTLARAELEKIKNVASGQIFKHF